MSQNESDSKNIEQISSNQLEYVLAVLDVYQSLERKENDAERTASANDS